MKRSVLPQLLIITLAMLGLRPIARGSQVVSQTSACVFTDKADYAPGETVKITGCRFGANENVTVQVLHINWAGDNDTSPAHQPWQVRADANGGFQTVWLVPSDQDEAGGTFEVTATGSSSGLTASATFTDSSTFNLDQLQNGTPTTAPEWA